MSKHHLCIFLFWERESVFVCHSIIFSFLSTRDSNTEINIFCVFRFVFGGTFLIFNIGELQSECGNKECRRTCSDIQLTFEYNMFLLTWVCALIDAFVIEKQIGCKESVKNKIILPTP